MAMSRYWPVLLGLLLLAADQPRPAEPPRMPRADDDAAAPAAPTDPRVLVLTQEEYQKLRDEIARLKARVKERADSDKPDTPAYCHLTGRVEGNLLKLHVQFDFRTEGDEPVRVALACGQANPTDAKLDGQPGVFKKTDDGINVLVTKSGDHQATLDLEANLVSRDTERGFTLDLPRAAVTSLDLDLPKDVKAARVGKETSEVKPNGETGKLKRPALGPLERLEVYWAAQAGVPNAPPQVDVESRTTVRVEESAVTTEVEMTLKPAGGPALQWTLVVPPGAEMVKRPSLDDRVVAIESTDPKQPFRTLKLKEALSRPLTLTFRLTQPRASDWMPIGPFGVHGAASQRGNIVVSASPEVQLRFQPRGDLVQRDLTEEEHRRDTNAVAAFQFWSLPAPEKPDRPPPAPLALEARPLKGEVEVRVTHLLRLTSGEAGARPFWRLTTTLEGEAFRAKLESLQVQLPPDYQFDEQVGVQPNSVVQAPPTIDPTSHVATIPLLYREPGPFKLTLEGFYASGEGEGRTALELPRPRGVRDRGASVTVGIPEDLEFSPARLADPQREAVLQDPHRQIWRYERIPSRIEVATQAYRPELAARSLTDLTIDGRQVRARQRLWFEAPSRLTTVGLRVPEATADSLVIVEGGRFDLPAATGQGAGYRNVTLTPKGDPAQPLVLDYQFALPVAAEGERGPALRLVEPRGATRGEARVRIWCDAGLIPQAPGGAWEEQGLEVAPDHDSLPTLVLHAGRPDLPLTLTLARASTASLATVRLERVLARVDVAEGGFQYYRVRFLIGQVPGRHVDLELPGQAATLNLKVLVAGKVAPWQAVDEGKAEPGRVVRVPWVKPAGPGDLAVLDVGYQLPPHRPGEGPIFSTLMPPAVRGTAGWAPVRWQVNFPVSWIGFDTGSVMRPGTRWVWRGGLLVPRSGADAADLERWFAGGEAPVEEAPELADSLVCFRSGLEPQRVGHVPRQAWLLVCSLGLLAGGLVALFLPITRAVLMPVGAVLALAAGAATLVWPGVLAEVAYGCEPGAAVLLIVLAAQWVAHARYRRQVVFLPSFTRVKAGSSLVRGTVSRPRGEPSTVDAMPPGNSQWAGGPSKAEKSPG